MKLLLLPVIRKGGNIGRLEELIEAVNDRWAKTLESAVLHPGELVVTLVLDKHSELSLEHLSKRTIDGVPSIMAAIIASGDVLIDLSIGDRCILVTKWIMNIIINYSNKISVDRAKFDEQVSIVLAQMAGSKSLSAWTSDIPFARRK